MIKQAATRYPGSRPSVKVHIVKRILELNPDIKSGRLWAKTIEELEQLKNALEKELSQVTTVKYLIDDKLYDPVAVGDKGRGDGYGKCPECFAGKGESHLAGCKREKCPKCHKQLRSCGCRWVMMRLSGSREEIDKLMMSKGG
jgi:hypothetical protein